MVGAVGRYCLLVSVHPRLSVYLSLLLSAVTSVSSRSVMIFLSFVAHSKRWRLRRSDVTSPLRGLTPHYHRVDTKEQQLKVHRLSNTDIEFATALDAEETVCFNRSRMWCWL